MTRFRDLPFGRLVGVVLVFVLVLAYATPSVCLARVEYVNGSDSAEGDPGDGNGAASGGMGDVGDEIDGSGSPAGRSDWTVFLVLPALYIGNSYCVLLPVSRVSLTDWSAE